MSRIPNSFLPHVTLRHNFEFKVIGDRTQPRYSDDYSVRVTAPHVRVTSLVYHPLLSMVVSLLIKLAETSRSHVNPIVLRLFRR